MEELNEEQKRLAILLVEELKKHGALDDVITDYNVESVRVCRHCHKLMNEGWLVEDIETYCSDECFLAACPEMTQEDINALDTDDENTIAYWTAWESA